MCTLKFLIILPISPSYWSLLTPFLSVKYESDCFSHISVKVIGKNFTLIILICFPFMSITMLLFYSTAANIYVIPIFQTLIFFHCYCYNFSSSFSLFLQSHSLPSDLCKSSTTSPKSFPTQKPSLNPHCLQIKPRPFILTLKTYCMLPTFSSKRLSQNYSNKNGDFPWTSHKCVLYMPFSLSLWNTAFLKNPIQMPSSPHALTKCRQEGRSCLPALSF